MSHTNKSHSFRFALAISIYYSDSECLCVAIKSTTKNGKMHVGGSPQHILLLLLSRPCLSCGRGKKKTPQQQRQQMTKNGNGTPGDTRTRSFFVVVVCLSC